MNISFDFGGSTVDAVIGDEVKTYESEEVPILSLERFLRVSGISLEGVEKVFVTGGKSRFFEEEVFGVEVVKISEIEAIGLGGVEVSQVDLPILVVSMGTGTCIVSVKDEIKHLGGTGVGGGTFLGLSRELLGISDLEEVLEIGEAGSAQGVDLSVEELVGGGIGRISGEVTASNLGKLAREIDFKKEDLAAGIINLIGQTIGAAVVFAAQAEGISRIVLTGKLTRAQAVTDVIKRIAGEYDLEILVPEKAEFASAIGCRVAGEALFK